jgi:hypothetical protein
VIKNTHAYRQTERVGKKVIDIKLHMHRGRERERKREWIK